ncbi:MAG: hypothetical protein ACRETM_11650 [Stenotrophobium sp.]
MFQKKIIDALAFFFGRHLDPTHFLAILCQNMSLWIESRRISVARKRLRKRRGGKLPQKQIVTVCRPRTLS